MLFKNQLGNLQLWQYQHKSNQQPAYRPGVGMHQVESNKHYNGQYPIGYLLAKGFTRL
jgi:hypothetical protein